MDRGLGYQRYSFLLAALLAVFAATADLARGQELDPRAYVPAPVGVNIVTVGYTHSTGDIVFDPSLPVKDAKASLHFGAAGYYRSLSFLGRFANLSVGIPYAAGHLSGLVANEPKEIYRSGLGDIRLRFAVNLKGTPAMTVGEFMKHHVKTNIGASIIVSMPTGQYDPAKIINVGQNRWAFKPEVGLSRALGKWDLDAYGAAWFFTANDNFTGKTQKQAALASFQFHLSYNFPNRAWAGLDANFYTGGRTEIDGVPSPVVVRNSRIGGTFAFPVSKTQFVKFAASRGAFTTRGGDFTSVGVSYNYAWGGKR